MSTEDRLVDALRYYADDANWKLNDGCLRNELNVLVGGYKPGSTIAKQALAEHEAYLAALPASEAKAAIDTLQKLGYTYHGGVLWKPPLGPRPVFAEELAQKQEARGNES